MKQTSNTKGKVKRKTATRRFLMPVYQTVERKSSQYQNFYSLADIFDHYHGLIWIDGAHVTPIGNRLIAARMLDVIQARSSEEKQSTISD
jgi:hypothetical protein